MRALPIFGLLLLVSACRSEALGVGYSDDLAPSTTCSSSADGTACGMSSSTCPSAGCAPKAGGCAAITDEAVCISDVTCKAVMLCGEWKFLGCSELDAPQPMFGPFCYITRCNAHLDEASCAGDSECHGAYTQKTTLDCPPQHPDCNIGFDHCALGPAS